MSPIPPDAFGAELVAGTLFPPGPPAAPDGRVPESVPGARRGAAT